MTFYFLLFVITYVWTQLKRLQLLVRSQQHQAQNHLCFFLLSFIELCALVIICNIKNYKPWQLKLKHSFERLIVFVITLSLNERDVWMKPSSPVQCWTCTILRESSDLVESSGFQEVWLSMYYSLELLRLTGSRPEVCSGLISEPIPRTKCIEMVETKTDQNRHDKRFEPRTFLSAMNNE